MSLLLRFFPLYLLMLALTPAFNLHGIGEKVPWHILKRILPDNPTIVEAGAQFGEDTRWMAEFWPRGKIFAFEPAPESYLTLYENAKSHANIYTFQQALSDKRGQFSFYLAGGASSLLRPRESFNRDYFHSDLDHPIVVEALTLDDWRSEHQLGDIDFLWLDMEGNELNALKGAESTLDKVKLIYTEVNLQRFWEGCVMYEELKSWLMERGFHEIWSDFVPHWHGNVLFFKP